MKYIVHVLIISFMCQLNAYAENGYPQNVVYNNGPVAGSGEGVAMERLRATEKELERTQIERNAALDGYRKAKDESHFGTNLLWTVIGIAAGGAGTYALTRGK